MKKNFFVIIALVLPFAASAATLRLVPNQNAVDLRQPFSVDLVLDSATDAVNAVQATLTFPTGKLALTGLSTGNSVVSFWVVQPKEISSGTVVLSGIIPGGFQGNGGRVVSLLFKSLAEGAATIRVASATVLRNDGEGTPVEVVFSSGNVIISSKPYDGPDFPIDQNTSPDHFTPVVARDPNIFGGKYFMAFSTTDKGSGIDHYDVVEVPAGTQLSDSSAWQTASSPRLLDDQSLSRDIYVRAVNRAGKMTIEKIPAGHQPIGGWVAVIGFALAIMILLTLWATKRRRH